MLKTMKNIENVFSRRLARKNISLDAKICAVAIAGPARLSERGFAGKWRAAVAIFSAPTPWSAPGAPGALDAPPFPPVPFFPRSANARVTPSPKPGAIGPPGPRSGAVFSLAA